MMVRHEGVGRCGDRHFDQNQFCGVASGQAPSWMRRSCGHARSAASAWVAFVVAAVWAFTCRWGAVSPGSPSSMFIGQRPMSAGPGFEKMSRQA